MTPAGPIRLTVDRDLQAWRTGAMAFNDADPGVPLIGKQCILELKYRRETPRLFKLLIEEFALDVRSISKYRLAVTALGLVEDAAAPARNRSAEAAFELVYA
jgi:hypothetical protein